MVYKFADQTANTCAAALVKHLIGHINIGKMIRHLLAHLMVIVYMRPLLIVIVI